MMLRVPPCDRQLRRFRGVGSLSCEWIRKTTGGQPRIGRAGAGGRFWLLKCVQGEAHQL